MKPIRAWAIFDKKGNIIGCVNYLVYRSYYVARAALDPLERFGHSMDEVEIRPLKKEVCECGHLKKSHKCLWCCKRRCKEKNYIGCFAKKCQCPEYRPKKRIKR